MMYTGIMKKLILPLLLFITSCYQPVFVEKTSFTPAITGDSVVALVEAYVKNDVDVVPESIQLRETCSAFGATDGATKFLVTAKHCLDHVKPGDKFRYEYTNGIGTEIAEVASFNGDVLFAIVNDKKLHPFEVDRTYEPRYLDLAVSVSVPFQSVSYGRVVSSLGSNFYDTDQTITRGWSGSPVINEDGNVWGVISMCKVTRDKGNDDCDPSYAVVSSIY